MKKPLTILIITSVFLSAILIVSLQYANIQPIQNTSKQFIIAVAQQDDTNPYTTLQINRSLKSAKVEDIHCDVLAYSKLWAKSLVVAELTLADNTPDVGWYELELVKQDIWKVVSINKVNPPSNGYTKRVNQHDIEEIKRIFTQYLSKVKKADYQLSIQYLAGPAREAHEKYANQLGSEPLIKDFTNVQVKPLWNNRKYAVLEIIYKVDDRKVNIIAGFYKTNQGWRLVKL